jgi:peptidyl-prolyl cis-trans isomerase B (cyclophilin B)
MTRHPLLVVGLALIGLAIPAFTNPAPETAAAATAPTTAGDTMQQIKNFIQEQTTKGTINKADASWRTKLPKFPEVKFEAGKSCYWNLQTNKGKIKVGLYTAQSPNHAANFVYLTELGFFDGLGFHRVIQQFMAQGGCPLGTGTGGPGYKFAGEFGSGLKHDRPGLLSMANAGPGTDGSQFFLTTVPTPWLDGNHTIFGEIVDGMDTLKKIEAAGSQSGRTSEKLVIEKATITVE